MSHSKESERVYWGTPEASPERVSAWARWVDDYAIGTAIHWVDAGQTDEDTALDASAVLVADWQHIDPMPWMPLGEAMTVRAGAQFAPQTRELKGDERTDYMRALRTFETATDRERTYAMSYQLGIAYSEAKKMIDKIRVAFGRESEADGKTALYRYFDKNAVLLYVGITKDPGARDEQHARSSAWHPLHIRREVQWFEMRSDAEVAERSAIRDEAPLFNATHASPDTRRKAMDYLFSRIAGSEAVAS